jgi:hypothetical protein
MSGLKVRTYLRSNDKSKSNGNGKNNRRSFDCGGKSAAFAQDDNFSEGVMEKQATATAVGREGVRSPSTQRPQTGRGYRITRFSASSRLRRYCSTLKCFR